MASASATEGDTTIDIDYTYDINGLRTSKTITRTTGSGTAHTHEYTSAVTAPTCTTAGYTTYTCDCGESYVDNLVDALGHNYVQSGNVYTCSRCGDSYTGHEHSYTEETTQPTCTTAGYTVYTCSCGDSYTVNIPALGHNYVLVNQTGNVATYQCSRCGHRYTAVVPVDPNPPVEYGLRNGNITVTTERHDYVYASGKLLREVITTTDAEGNVTTETLVFTYDASGSPYTVTRIVGTSSSTYYYVVNPQGDVIRLVSANGATVAEYTYDPWGRVISATGTMAEVNPLRYRGYYYDAETEFYYLQSRYYDPVICRFVNADGYASTGQGFLGQNMFAYCLNSPVDYSDHSGHAAGRSFVYVMSDAGVGVSPEALYGANTYATLDDAAVAFVVNEFWKTRLPSAVASGMERAAVLYRKQFPDGTVRYCYGDVIVGYHGEVSLAWAIYEFDLDLQADGWEIVGDVHTHPGPEQFSSGEGNDYDKINFMFEQHDTYIAGYVATTDNKIYKYTASERDSGSLGFYLRGFVSSYPGGGLPDLASRLRDNRFN